MMETPTSHPGPWIRILLLASLVLDVAGIVAFDLLMPFFAGGTPYVRSLLLAFLLDVPMVFGALALLFFLGSKRADPRSWGVVACLAMSSAYAWKSVERLAFTHPTTILAWFTGNPIYFLLPLLQLLALALLSTHFLGKADRRTMTLVLVLLALLCLLTLQQSWQQVAGLVAGIGAGEPLLLESARHLYLLSDDGNLFLFLALLLLVFRARAVLAPAAGAPPRAPAVHGGEAP